MEVFEINYNDYDETETVPFLIYSTVGINFKGVIQKLIHIETKIDSKELEVEVIGNDNYYCKSKIENNVNKLNIFSFIASDDIKYFIKISTYEYREILENSVLEDVRVDLLFYGFYTFDNNILNLIDKNKLKNICK